MIVCNFYGPLAGFACHTDDGGEVGTNSCFIHLPICVCINFQMIYLSYIQIMEIISNVFLFEWFRPRWQGDCCHTGDGDGGGGRPIEANVFTTTQENRI